MYKIFAVLLLSVSISTSANETDHNEDHSKTDLELEEESVSVLQRLLETQYGGCTQFPLCEGPNDQNPPKEDSESPNEADQTPKPQSE